MLADCGAFFAKEDTPDAVDDGNIAEVPGGELKRHVDLRKKVRERDYSTLPQRERAGNLCTANQSRSPGGQCILQGDVTDDTARLAWRLIGGKGALGEVFRGENFNRCVVIGNAAGVEASGGDDYVDLRPVRL